jgi:glycosyltransferase involved in cell wall biosynthesis
VKVLILSSFYTPYVSGGAEVILQAHVKALQESGVSVAVLTTGPGSGLTCETVDGVRVWRAGVRNLYFHYGTDRHPHWQRMLWHALDVYNPFMKGYVRQVVERERPQLASCHVLRGWSISVWDALVACGVPVVQVLHDQYLLCAKSLMFKDNRVCARQCGLCRILRLPHPGRSRGVSALVAPSQFLLDKMLAYGYFRGTPVRQVIRNPGNSDCPPDGAVPRVPDGNLVFGFIGTVAQHKGVELLLDAFAGCAPANWRLRIAGTGSPGYLAGLKARHPDPRIVFLGHCQPREFFGSIDVSVVPSLCQDNFPGAVSESLQFGVPVIGSDRGGIPEMIEAGSSGLLFDPDRPGSLASALLRMAGELASFAPGRILTLPRRFSDRQEWNEQWLELYRRVISGSKG